MAARKLLYLLRRPLKDGYVDHLLPSGTSASEQRELTMVLLEDAEATDVPFPGRMFILSGSRAEKEADSSVPRISYDDLLKLIFEADVVIPM